MSLGKRAFGVGMTVALTASLFGGAVAAQDPVVILSTQMVPEEEAAKMRDNIMAGYEGDFDFVGSDGGPFVDTIRAEAEAGSGDTGTKDHQLTGSRNVRQMQELRPDLAAGNVSEDQEGQRTNADASGS